jgi:hypothetical protein
LGAVRIIRIELMEGHVLEDIDKPVAEIQERELPALLRCENVVGVGVGRRICAGRDTGEPCLTVFVTKKVALDAVPAESRIPRTIKHCTTDVVVIGEVRGDGEPPGLEPPEARSDQRARPARGGASLGHYRAAGGTLGTAVIEQDAYPGIPERYYVLSTNRVLADCNTGEIGDPVLQPRFADGGRDPADVIGRLSRFVPLRFDGEVNWVDAALAEVHFGDVDRSVAWIGHAREALTKVRIGQLVKKTGRGTHFTSGSVRAVNVVLKVRYGSREALFARQIVTTPLSSPADSGALLFDREDRPVGLLFACSEYASVANPIGLVESLLKVRVGF